jgi:hypothetical protein
MEHVLRVEAADEDTIKDLTSGACILVPPLGWHEFRDV